MNVCVGKGVGGGLRAATLHGKRRREGKSARDCVCLVCVAAEFMSYLSCRTLSATCFLLTLWSTSKCTAFVVVPDSTSGSGGGGCDGGIKSTGLHQYGIRSVYRRRQALSSTPRAQTAAAQRPVANDLGELSAKEVVEQAGARLTPLFAQVDAHTQLWVTWPVDCCCLNRS